MVDVSKIISFVEKQLGNKSNQDGKIQTENAAEYSLFMAEMGRQVREEGLGKEDFNNMLNEAFGLELSNTGATSAARGIENSGKEANDTNINITINIDIDIVVKACGGSEVDLQKLVDMLIAEMTKEGGSVENFIIGLIQAFGGTGDVNFGQLKSLLEKIENKLDKQGQKIDDLQKSIDNLGKYLKDQFESLFKTLERYAKQYGIDISDIKQMLKDCNDNDTEILTKLGEIYSAILDLTGMFKDFTDVEQQRFKEVMDAIGNIKVDAGDTTAIAEKLNLMHSLLLAIQGDTTATKSNSEELITLVKEGKKEVLDAIKNINFDVTLPDGYDDTGLRAFLSNLLANMVTKDDLKKQTDEFNQIVENLKAYLTTAAEKDKKDILNAIDNINIDIKLPEGYDDSGLRTFLTNLFANVVTKDDLKAQTEHFNQVVANLKQAFETAIEADKIAILNAINSINIDIKLPEGYDDSGLKSLLSQVLTNMVTKEDLNAQLTKFKQIVADTQKAIEIAVKNSETDIIKHIDTISQNIITHIDGQNNDAVISLLNKILAKLDECDGKNAANFTKVLEAIANIKTGEPVDLSEVLRLLNEIDDLAKANGGKLDDVLNNQETIALTLNGIVDGLNRLEGKVDGIKDVVDDIQDMVSKLHNCDCECIDEAKFRQILCEFLQQLNKDVNEGIIGDVDEVLGARGNAPAQRKSYKQMVSELRDVLGLKGDTGVTSVRRDDNNSSKVYDLSGREVTELKPGQVYIRDGKKFIAK